MFWPFAIAMPRRFFIWSVPDGTLFPNWLNWLYGISHCIKVDRGAGSNQSSVKVMVRVLKSGSTITLHPEGGRTDSRFREKNVPRKQFGVNTELGTKIRRIQSKVPELAILAQARITPLWVDVPFKDEQNCFKKALWLWLRHRHTVTLSVRDSYRPDRSMTSYDRNKELGKRILDA